MTLSLFRQGAFSKIIAATTLSFFAWTFCLSQPAYAVQQDLTQEQRAEAAYDAMMEKTPDAKFTHRLQKLKDKVTREIAPAVADREQHAGIIQRGLRKAGLGRGPLDASERQQLADLQASIAEAWRGVDHGLTEVDSHLKARHVSGEVMKRQREAKATIRNSYQTLTQLLQALKAAKGGRESRVSFERESTTVKNTVNLVGWR